MPAEYRTIKTVASKPDELGREGEERARAKNSKEKGREGEGEANWEKPADHFEKREPTNHPSEPEQPNFNWRTGGVSQEKKALRFSGFFYQPVMLECRELEKVLHKKF